MNVSWSAFHLFCLIVSQPFPGLNRVEAFLISCPSAHLPGDPSALVPVDCGLQDLHPGHPPGRGSEIRLQESFRRFFSFLLNNLEHLIFSLFLFLHVSFWLVLAFLLLLYCVSSSSLNSFSPSFYEKVLLLPPSSFLLPNHAAVNRPNSFPKTTVSLSFFFPPADDEEKKYRRRWQLN